MNNIMFMTRHFLNKVFTNKYFFNKTIIESFYKKFSVSLNKSVNLKLLKTISVSHIEINRDYSSKKVKGIFRKSLKKLIFFIIFMN